jgi:hypothetical protein
MFGAPGFSRVAIPWGACFETSRRSRARSADGLFVNVEDPLAEVFE